ncbi:MAG: acetoacetate--CoA ligase [Deltaproteobacteria bacterium]|nr:acetoacetate--CoA ligase [Deltaproteobacteria bacterium]
MAKLLWQPTEERVRRTRMYRFMQSVNDKHGLELRSYPDLYRWSIEHIPDFWAEMWELAEIRASAPFEQVVDDPYKLPGAKWFSGARLNFAQNLLRVRDERTALVFQGEDREPRRMSYAELHAEVAAVASALKRAGVQAGDRVAGFMPNMIETVVAMLATTSLGAIWSSCSPDFGLKGVLDRFGQIKPRVLFTADGYTFKGRWFDSLERVGQILRSLPSVERVVVVPLGAEAPELAALPQAVRYEDFRDRSPGLEIDFVQSGFSHPLYIMFTSGTTGLPKCMVQSAGGVLLNQLKELMLHTDLSADEVIFYYTTCGWMMWNWLVCSLAVGATVVLYDGNPFHPDPGVLWRLAQDQKISVFGTSAGYLSALMGEGFEPGSRYDLSSVRAVLSTGSPLSTAGFEYVYERIKPDVQLASIAGGSDINGCFFGGNPMGPVYAGELQCRCLGMKVEAWNDDGQPVVGEQGELVCTAAAPSMPIHFWDDDDGERYHSAYFDVFPGVWRHGDYISVNERGGVVIYGRSDATLNPGGVRIGTAEIYRQVEGIAEIRDSLVVGQSWKGDERVVLFVQMAEGHELDDELQARIRALVRKNASPRHVPAKIVAVVDIPYTLNMKKVELAVKRVIEGKPVLNREALRNPEALDGFVDLEELKD